MTEAMPSDQTAPRIAYFAANALGRDFVVGDVHGMFSALRSLLERAQFDASRDRVFSVGDLIDRGPESREALAWLDLPWFFACRGNHEQFVLDSSDPEQFDLWINHNGGQWWLAVDDAERRHFVARFRDLPLAMEVVTASGTVGIVHADVPPLMSWDGFVERLERGDEDAMFYAMWSRNRIAGVVSSLPVNGRVTRVYCGHTPTRSTVLVDNVHYIDTGAVYCSEGYQDARLTLVEIQPGPHREYTVYTTL
jgi:serine/threonine protein phosphatase 1